MSRYFLTVMLLCSSVAVADEIKLSPRHVAVTGTSTTRVQPDTVVWQINVRRANRELAKAQAECDDALKKVLALQTELKLKPEDIQTGHMSIQKIYDHDATGNQTSFRHFMVDRHVTLRQRDISRFDTILAKLIAAEDIEVGYSLESSELTAIRTKTRLDAVKAARTKAAEMTELLGAKLGRVLRIAEPQEFHGMPMMTNSFRGAAKAESDEGGGTFAPGTIEVKVSIDVAFEIE